MQLRVRPITRVRVATWSRLWAQVKRLSHRVNPPPINPRIVHRTSWRLRSWVGRRWTGHGEVPLICVCSDRPGNSDTHKNAPSATRLDTNHHHGVQHMDTHPSQRSDCDIHAVGTPCTLRSGGEDVKSRVNIRASAQSCLNAVRIQGEARRSSGVARQSR